MQRLRITYVCQRILPRCQIAHMSNVQADTALLFCQWHIYQTEIFEVVRLPSASLSSSTLDAGRLLIWRPLTQVSGLMHYYLDGKEGLLKPGEKVVIRPGLPHTCESAASVRVERSEEGRADPRMRCSLV